MNIYSKEMISKIENVLRKCLDKNLYLNNPRVTDRVDQLYPIRMSVSKDITIESHDKNFLIKYYRTICHEYKFMGETSTLTRWKADIYYRDEDRFSQYDGFNCALLLNEDSPHVDEVSDVVFLLGKVLDNVMAFEDLSIDKGSTWFPQTIKENNDFFNR